MFVHEGVVLVCVQQEMWEVLQKDDETKMVHQQYVHTRGFIHTHTHECDNVHIRLVLNGQVGYAHYPHFSNIQS